MCEYTDRLLYEAKRRPGISELVEKAAFLTDDEIATASVPMPWYRVALKKLREQHRQNAQDDFDDVRLLDLLPLIKDGTNPDPMGMMLEWVGGDEWVDIGHGNFLMVATGKLLWTPASGGLWIDTVYVPYVPSIVHQNVRQLRMVSKSDYTLAVKDLLAGRVFSGAVIAVDSQASEAVGRLSGLGVRIVKI